MQMRQFDADKAWNDYAMSHALEREAYEKDVDALGEMSASDYERGLALQELALVKHRRYCLGFAGEPGAFHLFDEMVCWHEIVAAYGIDKWTQDELLNEESHWYKTLFGVDSSIHHNHEPAKGVSFRFGSLNAPVTKKRPSVVSIKNNPAASNG